jgi:thiamine-monophosphate kinase
VHFLLSSLILHPSSLYSESSILEWLRSHAAASARVPIPIGDDLAGLRLGASDGLVLVGIDQVLDRVHFDLREHAPELVGRKAMNRNLSDCAAMACEPVAAVMSMALPRGAGVDLAKSLINGAREAGERFGCALVGGDTGSWDGPLGVTVAVVGAARGVEPVRRSGATPGDSLFISGPLGGSILGRHLTFEPRVTLARELARTCEVRAMLDISDGVSRDLPRLCVASGVGATLDASLIPIHPDARKLPGDPLDHALHDGEDYELLFASPRCDHPGAIRIGTIDAEPGVRLKRDGVITLLEAHGWDHAI